MKDKTKPLILSTNLLRISQNNSKNWKKTAMIIFNIEINILTSLFAGRLTSQVRKPADLQTFLADREDVLASKSEWGRNSRINFQDLVGQFVRWNSKPIDRFLIHLQTVKEGTHVAIILKSENGEDNFQAGPNIAILSLPQSSKPTKCRRVNTTSPQKWWKFDTEAVVEDKNG